MRLTRRTLLGTAGALPVASAGCLAGNSNDVPSGDASGDGSGDGSDGSPSDGDGSNDDGSGDRDAEPTLMDFEVSEYALAPDAERHSDMDAWGLFVASAEAADTYYGDLDGQHAEEVRSFVEETEFGAGDTLLFAEAYAPQTCYELVLESDPHVAENGLPAVDAVVDRLVPEDEPCGDAMTAVQLLVRLSFDPEGAPADVVEVTISGHRDQPEELFLEAER